MKKLAAIVLAVMSLGLAVFVQADNKDAPTSQPSDAPLKVDVTDKDAVKAAEGSCPAE